MLKHKYFISFFLALCIMAQFVPDISADAVKKLVIAGTDVKLPMSGGITYENTGIDDSYWWLAYTDGEYRLTLSNAKIEGEIVSTLDNLTICVPQGTESIINSNESCISSSGDFKITGSGTLSLFSNSADSAAAISATNKFIITDAKINIKSSCATGIQSNSASFESGSVNISINYSGSKDCTAIAAGTLSIEKSDVTLNVEGDAGARAIFCDFGLTISESTVICKVSAKSGGTGIAAKSGLYMSESIVDVCANSNTLFAVGIDSQSTSLNFTIAGGNIKAEGFCTDVSRDYAYGIRAHLLYVAGGSVNSVGTDGGIAVGDNQSDSITLGDCVNKAPITSADNASRHFETFSENVNDLSFLASGYITGGTSPVILKSSLSALSILGSPRAGQQLTAALSPASADAQYRWYRSNTPSNADGIPISGADKAYYIPSSDDIGKYIYCTASGILGFSGTVTSKCTDEIGASLNLPLYSVNISGYAKVGSNLSAEISPAEASVRYEWFRCTSPDSEGILIKDAKSPQYTLTSEDAGMYIYCVAYGIGDYTGNVRSSVTDMVEKALQTNVPTLIYVPLDNRTVNVDRVVYEAESAGFKVIMPKEDLYATRLDGQPRNSNGTGHGDGKAIIKWLEEMDEYSDYFVISLDQLLSGGLVNSRAMTNTDLSEEYDIINEIVKLSDRNHIYILDTVARLATCTLGYEGADLASYYYLRSYNIQPRVALSDKQLTVDNIIAGYAKDESGKRLEVDSNYAKLVENSILVRERKLKLTDHILSQDYYGKMKYFIGVDDSNSQTTVQTNEVNYIKSKMGDRGTIYSGTDELGMMAVLRLMIDYYGSRVKASTMYFGDTQDSDSGSSYDIETVRENVEQHLASVGVKIADKKDSNIEIVVLTSPAKTTMNAKYITQMLDYINNNINAGIPTIVINPVPSVYGNTFEYRIIQECETSMLLAYSSWGTVGNAIGIALANGISRYLYLQSSTTSSSDADVAFLKGLSFSLIKDISYIKGGGKALFAEYIVSQGLSTDNFYTNEESIKLIYSNLENILKTSEYNVTVNDVLKNLQNRRYIKGLNGECGVIENITLSNFSAPFYRVNEIRFDIDIDLSGITIKGVSGDVSVSLPYTPPEGEFVYDLNVYYKDASGKIEYAPCTYNPADGSVVFTVNNFSGVFISSMSISSKTPLYKDVSPDAWYYSNVAFVSDNKLMNGTSENMFEPESPVTRAMFISILHRIAESETSQNIKSPFSDVSPSDWYYDAVLWAFKSGIITGRTDGSARTQENITRQEAAVLMYRFAAYFNADLSLSGEMLSCFDDRSEIDGYARTAVEWVAEKGIVSAMPDNKIYPNALVSRAQAAAMFQRLWDTLK
ncbi:MAG: DUF4127 family protein [Clostridia bacterium]|nr:DUF4127 family protein [Clostridia bacterium]